MHRLIFQVRKGYAQRLEHFSLISQIFHRSSEEHFCVAALFQEIRRKESFFFLQRSFLQCLQVGNEAGPGHVRDRPGRADANVSISISVLLCKKKKICTVDVPTPLERAATTSLSVCLLRGFRHLVEGHT